ncbi:MAG: hypothetical protein FWF70_03175 [Bacteroidetes bacterium]|nr:hypothetical protein [Bacteroidota bacterium]MCL1968426.1 hypothetical protein [Bacteroidota bacterium]
MKKYIFILTAAIMVAMVFNACPPPPEPDNPGILGDGSEINPFKVVTVADLKRVGSNEVGPEGLKWSDDKNYRQIAHIDLSKEPNWKPVGDHQLRFSGVYDGGGYTISNLTISNIDKENRGLFGIVFGTVKNVRLDGVIISGKKDVGCIAGTLQSHGTIDHCSVKNIDIFCSNYVGGIAGWVSNTSTVNNCIVTEGKVNGTGTYEGNGWSGGIAGHNAGTIKNCYATVDVSGYQFVGGIAGDNSGNGTILYCYATGNVFTDFYRAGGIAGENSGIIKNCVALNSEVKRKNKHPFYTTPEIGRITGYVFNDFEMNNNYARFDMALKEGETNDDVPLEAEATLTGIHGANVFNADCNGANSGTWWKNTAGFSDAQWSFAPNRLPWLNGFNGLTQNPTIIP